VHDVVDEHVVARLATIAEDRRRLAASIFDEKTAMTPASP